MARWDRFFNSYKTLESDLDRTISPALRNKGGSGFEDFKISNWSGYVEQVFTETDYVTGPAADDTLTKDAVTSNLQRLRSRPDR